MEEDVIDDYWANEIWKTDEFEKWKAAKEAQEKEKLQNSGRYKQYKRYMKKNAGSTISFVDDV